MDHHTPITETTPFGQENNQLLLNAIKNKFASQTAHEAASFSPPKFTIPTLKTLDDGGNAKVMTISASAKNQEDNRSNQLNHFLLKQLQQNQSSQDITKGNGFELPQLQFGKEKTKGSNFDIPLLKSSTAAISSDSGVSSLTAVINKLQLYENAVTSTSSTVNHPASTTTPAIDLTSALASKSSHLQGTPPTRDFQAKLKQQSSKSDFVIPFIDCDRLDNATAMVCALVAQNEHCLTDISQLPLKPLYKEQPSPLGRFLYIVDKRYVPVPLKCITSAEQYKLMVKHVIQPFQFDTKSPDDKVLESLSKYKRR